MEKFFEYENTTNNRKVKLIVTRLKGHASLWWEHLQTKKTKETKGEHQHLAKNSEQGKEQIPSY